MTNKRIIIYLLAAFASGNALLIYIEYNSYKNINNLISGNEKVLAEIDVINNLRELKRDITLVEGRLDGRRYHQDSAQRRELKTRIIQVQNDIDQLQQISDDDSSVKYIDVLDTLIREKLFSNRNEMDSALVPAVHYNGLIPVSSRARMLSDSIRLVTRIIENSRQKLLAKATLSIDNSGKKALHFGALLISVVLLSGAVLFWLIIATIRKQHLLIQQLNESEKRGRETALIKEKFMANMSHEIRTPLNAILGFTNLLQRRSLDEDSMIYIQTIQKSCEKLLTIVNDILDLSKIEAGMMRIETAPFTIRGLVHSVEHMFKPTIIEKKLSIAIDIEAGLPDVLEGDATRLTQILVNLIGNSIKFTNHGTITVKIFNHGITGLVVNTGIEVSDTGIGIEKNMLDHIFDRFHQAEDTVTRNFEGTGLGLAIVRELVLLQGGMISVESVVGVGTSFKLVIPYRISSVEVYDSKSPRENALGPGPDFGGVSVLVVEDNEINQSLIRHLFKNWRLKYELAVNGKDALEKLRMNSYDLILMDIQMPEMDGYTATQQIRNDLHLTIPIIAMTAHALAGEREKCLSYGMNEYISKPIREMQLLNLIGQFTNSNLRHNAVNRRTVKGSGREYQIIDLSYMKEISKGNTDYEKTVTSEFIVAVEEELKSIGHAWKHGDFEQVKQLAHNLKTTISVMGLNEKLKSFLDALEYEDLHEELFKSNFESLQFICEVAITEARQFHATL